MVSEELLNKLKKSFPKSFINSSNEFIGLLKHRTVQVNSWFRLENVENDLELKCKVLEYFSRPSFKGFTFANQHYKQRQIGEEIYKYHLDGINDFLDTDFCVDDIEWIYTKLGCGINRKLCIHFIESNYDLSILRGKDNGRN